MDGKKFKDAHGPEFRIQAAFINFLKYRGWEVERMIGNAYQTGIPDIYVMHLKYGTRWIDLKVPGRYEFTQAQRHKWPKWEKKGVGIWIITAATDEEYDKLFHPPNMRDYWKDKYSIPPIDEILEDLYEDD